MTYPSASYRVMVMPDLHAPFHDHRAFDTFLEAAYVAQPSEMVLIGDTVDFYAVSFHDKDPDRRYLLKEEVQAANEQCLDVVASMGIPKVTYLLGNHENRYNRYLARNAPDLHGLCPTLQELLRIEQRGWDCHEYGTPYSVGKMDYVHDVGLCGKAAAQRSVEAYGKSVCIGHTHRLSIYHTGDAHDRHMCLNVGWLGSAAEVDYMHKWKVNKDWQHGFGLVDYFPNGNFSAQAIAINDGACIVDGKQVRV